LSDVEARRFAGSGGRPSTVDATLDREPRPAERPNTWALQCPVTRYVDAGAAVFHLRAVPWQVPGFDDTGSEDRLRGVDAHFRAAGSFAVTSLSVAIRAPRC